MKKILLLGGSSQQIIAINTAKQLGYYTVLCDYLIDNPGQFHADKFYLVSTTDKERVLDVAIKENVDGVLAYASDPAAPTAAYVAEKLGLYTNPYVSVDTLCNKDKFRVFLLNNGFNTPKAKGYSDKDDVLRELHIFSFPIIIKPVDSSGSKGATVLHEMSNINEALDYAFSFSRCKRIIVEEFIEKKHQYLIGGDIFVVNGEVKIWGLLNCHRDNKVNSLVPVGKSYPLDLDEVDVVSVKTCLQSLVNKLGIKAGAMNVELIIDKYGKVWPIDIGPRNGGNMIPDLLGEIFNINIVEMSIKVAMGENLNDIRVEHNEVYYATHNLHSAVSGVFKCVEFSKKISQYIIKKSIYLNEGDKVEYFDNASKALGIVFFKFDTKETMHNILDSIDTHITIKLEE